MGRLLRVFGVAFNAGLDVLAVLRWPGAPESIGLRSNDEIDRMEAP